MKNIVITFLVFGFFATYAQDDNESEVLVSFNKMLPIKFNIYAVPLKIKQVGVKNQINYANPEGILQSFYSANNKEWAMSDYLKKPETLVRDQGHFDAVKKRDIIKNYIQLETVYNFEYDKRTFAFLKYAIIDEHLPFPLLGILPSEKINGRWYISYLLNQNQVSTILVNFDNSVLMSLFSNTRNPNLENNLEKSMQMKDGKFSFTKADRIFDGLVIEGNKPVLKTLKDKRNIDETYKPPLAIENSKFIENKFSLPHPFLMDSTKYVEYSDSDSLIIGSEENLALWQKRPEVLLYEENKPIKLDLKFSFFWQNKQYNVIRYSTTLFPWSVELRCPVARSPDQPSCDSNVPS